ncbi:hypothetical protein ACO0LL_25800 [Undibacterium sp. TC4M20W]|uniref:hypothetical protein n=1 Tax=Undibacterium sp. TC4M20W TaxID=3413052 RepID=UPI003BF16854
MPMKRITDPDGLPYLIDTQEDDEQSNNWGSPGFQPAMEDASSLAPFSGIPRSSAKLDNLMRYFPVAMNGATDRTTSSEDNEQFIDHAVYRFPSDMPGLAASEILPYIQRGLSPEEKDKYIQLLPGTISADADPFSGLQFSKRPNPDYEQKLAALEDSGVNMQAATPVRGLLLRAMAAGDDAGDDTERSPQVDNEGDTYSDREDDEGWEDSPDRGIDDTAESPATQGYQTSAYSGQSTGEKNQAKKTGLLSQFTDTLARKEGNGFSAKGQDARFRNPMEQIPGNDPSIPEVQNSDGSWTLPFGGNAHPITPYNGHQILKGRDRPVSYSNAEIDEKNKIINVKVLTDYQKPSLFSRFIGLNKQVNDQEFEKYAKLADEGIANHWSRKVNLNGEDWKVNVRPERSKDGMPFTLANPGSKTIYGDLSKRSSNPYPTGSGKLYYDTDYGKDADAILKRTAGHEFGHAVLTDALSKDYSWGHEGTSTFYGDTYEKAPMYPATGEINLMQYYNDHPQVKLGQYINRSIASENDVKTLIHIAGRRK